LVESSLLIRLRASVAGCWLGSASEGITSSQLSVRLRLKGRSEDAPVSGAVETLMIGSVGMLGVRCVLRTESSSVESRDTRACILSSLSLRLDLNTRLEKIAHVRALGRGARLCLLRRHSFLPATQLPHLVKKKSRLVQLLKTVTDASKKQDNLLHPMLAKGFARARVLCEAELTGSCRSHFT
jgi:hypothetical protein